MPVEIIEGDCREVLKEFDASSIDAVVTDPPYGLAFMGKHWDYDVPDIGIWQEVLRVLKPGGHLLSFGGSRTYHRMAVAIEDAGFEIRDQIMWIYGSGFPKSSNQDGDWEGWGTALKPAHEPIVVARKPLIGTVSANLAKHGVGALNIDGARIHGDDAQGGEYTVKRLKPGATLDKTGGNWRPEEGGVEYHGTMKPGRWPANIIHDGSDEVLAAFPQARGQIADASSSSESRKTQNVYGNMKRGNGREGEASANDPNDGTVGFKMKPGARRDDSGSAARFFKSAEHDEGELLIWRAKAILGQWNPELANTADNSSSLSNRAVGSALSDAVTWASYGGRQLNDLTGLSTTVTPNELKRISEAAIATILSFESGCSLESPHVKPFLLNARASVAEATEPTGITTITISHWRSDGSAAPVTLKCTPQSTEAGGLGSGKRFAYAAKASKKDRDDGLTTLEKPVVTFATANGTSGKPSSISEGRTTAYKNTHPTVKPTDLMRYLCRLVTPPGGTVLDPFMGSGSTGRGAVLEGFSFIGIEMDASYYDIADARIAAAEATVSRNMKAAE